jgi:hypothetical protein
MTNNVYKFRRIKWADPRPKLKFLQEDIQRRLWLRNLPPIEFWILTALLAGVAFAAVFLVGLAFQ